jgi:hypothetical protein
MEENWLQITDFTNYSVSDLGRVRNDTTGKMMKLCIKSGYYHVGLTNNISKKTFKVHRLVAIAFIPNPENKLEVNHIDKNKLNNNLYNLEWNTRRENNIHRCIGLNYSNNRNKKVIRLDKKSNSILESYSSIEDAGIWVHKSGLTQNSHNGRNSIGNCITGLSKSAYGYLWKQEHNNDDLEYEFWKEVIIENILSDKKYFVSNLGRFKDSFGMVKDNYKVNENGYIRVLVNNKTYLLHRLIAIAFLENPNDKEHVNHLDGNKLNNHLENLEWATCSENNFHKYKIGLGNNFTRKIGQFDLEGNLIKEFISIASASKEMKTSKSNIGGVLTHNRKTAKGFIWKYLD